MIEQGKISGRQLKILVFLFGLGSAILIVPSAITSAAKQDGWISAIAGVIVGALLLYLYSMLAKRNPGLTLTELSERILGKWAGKAASLLFFSYFYLLSALVLRNIGDFITTIVMPETPIQSIFILFVLIVVMGAYLGLEVIARASEIFLPWILILLFILVIFIMPQMEIIRFKPILDTNVKTIISGSLILAGIPYLEMIIFLMLTPFVNDSKRAGRALIWGGISAGAVLFLITLLCILVLGWDFTARHAFPSYTLAKKIRVGEFLQRIEVLMAVIWFLTIFFKLVVCFYSSALTLAQVFNLRTYRPLLFPLALIMIVLSLLVYPNNVYFRTFASQTWISYALIFGLIIPLILLIGSMARKKKPPHSPEEA